MKAYVIALPEQYESVDVLKQSIKDTESDIDLKVLDATTPKTIDQHLQEEFRYFNTAYYKWTWPRHAKQNHHDMATGLYMFAYRAANFYKKEACSISHMRAWDKCVQEGEPIIIFEADAKMIRQFDPSIIRSGNELKIIGLNDPRYTTRRADLFHELVSKKEGIQNAPTVNGVEEFVPQGLAGGSAYVITPVAAKRLLDSIRTYGVWPNDAYICKELFPWIRVVYPYYTKVQGTPSTTVN